MRKITNILRQLPRLCYGALLSPLLVYTIRRYPTLHKKIAAPLLDGPYRGRLVYEIQNSLYSLESGIVSNEEFICSVVDHMADAVKSGELKEWLESPVRADENVDIVLAKCLNYSPLKRWYLKLHFMAPGNVHGLHAHTDVLSTQVVARGNIKLQEFDIVGDSGQSRVKLQIARDGIFGPLEKMVSTNLLHNIHGFEPADGPMVRFQFYLRGQTSLKQRMFPKRGRLYVHPLWDTYDGTTVLARLASDKPGYPTQSDYNAHK